MHKSGTYTEPTGQTRRNDRMRKLQSGQSLAEVAVSMVILVMLFSAIVDFGRAFFTVVALNNMISEGAHWAAAYPQCIVTANNATNAPQVDPKCRGTNSIIGRMLNENQDLDQSSIIGLSITAKDTNGQPVALTSVQAGNDLTINITYQMPTITPIIRSMFGNSLTLSAEAKEVVRGKDRPETDGTAMTSNGSIAPAYALAGIQQLPAACSSGRPTLQWTAVSATGYHIYKTASVTYTGNTVTSPATPYYDYTPSSAIGTLMTWQDSNAIAASLGTGGTQAYTVTAYNNNGTIYDSTPVTFTASCAAVKPINVTYQCTSGGTYGSATFYWSMPTPTDTVVAGYQVVPGSGTTPTSLVVTGNSASVQFALASDRTRSYKVQPLNSSNAAIGSASDLVNINCTPGLQGQYFNDAVGGSQFTTLALTRIDSTISFAWNTISPATVQPDPTVNATYFSVRWTGKIWAPANGNYTFYVTGDDGYRLYLGDMVNPILGNWSEHGTTTSSQTVSLVGGQMYDIKLEYYQVAGQDNVKLEWSSNTGISRQVIPSNYLYPPGS